MRMGKIFDIAGRALDEVIYQGRYLDQVTAFWIAQNKHWSDSEKYLFANVLQETTRWWRLLNELVPPSFPQFGSHTHKIVALYLSWNPQGIYMERKIPDNSKKLIQEKYKKVADVRAIAESIPDWLDELGEKEVGDNWSSELKALNQKPPIVIRVNHIKTTTDELYNWLKREGYKIKRLANSNALLLTEPSNIFRSETFKLGMFEQQDFSSQQVVPFLKAEPGMRIVDACAGNGGKTLHMASVMKNKGKILALDTAPWKLDELKRRARRAGISNIEIRPIGSAKTIKRLHGTSDRVLIDAPCSGLGVLKRNPDAKWKLTPETIDKLISEQRQVLLSYCPMVKPGGYIVYATCSILPSEGESQVRWFVEETNKRFTLEEEKRISPASSGFDGFYMARLKREF